MKQGIIVVNHGTSDFEARHNTIEEFVLSIGDRFEDADIASAYTDGEVRKKLREISGEKIQNLKATVLSMKERGVTHLSVVTTDIIEDDTHKKIREEVSSLAGLFRDVKITKPLLSDVKDVGLVARAFYSAFNDTVGDDHMVVVACDDRTIYENQEMDFLMGEVFDKPLESLENSLREFIKKSYVASVGGKRRLYKVIKEINAIEDGKRKRIVLIPFEFIAGTQVENEVSRKLPELIDRLKEEEYDVEVVFKGIGEYDAFQRLYLKHLYDER